jgi:hypothetical protein
LHGVHRLTLRRPARRDDGVGGQFQRIDSGNADQFRKLSHGRQSFILTKPRGRVTRTRKPAATPARPCSSHSSASLRSAEACPSNRASWERRPCSQRVRRQRARPSAVLGPVLFPHVSDSAACSAWPGRGTASRSASSGPRSVEPLRGRLEDFHSSAGRSLGALSYCGSRGPGTITISRTAPGSQRPGLGACRPPARRPAAGFQSWLALGGNGRAIGS